MKNIAVLGEYKIGKTLGEGSFSKVKLATHNENGEKYAVKIIDKARMRDVSAKSKKTQEERERQRIIAERKKARSESIKKQNMEYVASAEEAAPADAGPIDLHKLIKDLAKINADLENVELTPEPLRPEAEYMPNIQKEVKLLMRLDHPNVIKTYQIFDSEDECYIIMELAKGGELMEYITAHGRLSEKESRKFFRQIVSAMDHIHSANIVHRDLKLENVLLSKDMNCLISDFGLGRTYDVENVNDMKTFCGTPNYASVELVAGIPYNGIKSDIWAIGVILYIMVSGKRPFSGSTLAVLYQKILKLDYELPSYFSEELVDLLKRIFVRDPQKRITIQQIRDHPWVNIDHQEKILLVPALPPLDDAEDIGKAIGSVHNDNEFTVYILKAHSISKKSSPFTSDSSVKLSRINTSNGSSLKIEHNKSINFLEQAASKDVVMRSGRRASYHDAFKSSSLAQQKQADQTGSRTSQTILSRKSRTDQPDLTTLLPSSFSNELSRKKSVSSQLSQENRKWSITLSESSSNHIHGTVNDGNRGSVSTTSNGISRASSAVIRVSQKMLEDDDILDATDAADFKNIPILSRRMSIGPEKRAQAPVMIKEESFTSDLDLNTDIDNPTSTSQTHEEHSVKEYSYARRPSYRRASISVDPTSPVSPNIPKEGNAIRRASISVPKKDSSSSKNNISKDIEIPRVEEKGEEPRSRKRAITVTGVSGSKSNMSSNRFINEEPRDMWEDDSAKASNSESTTSRVSNRTTSISAGEKNSSAVITIDMINSWHQIHKPAKIVRTMRYSFNKHTTSSLYEPARIFQDVHKVLLDIADEGQDSFTLAFQRPTNLYLFECSVIYPQRDELLQFDIEVCKVWLLKMHGIRIKKQQGDSFDYKHFHQEIIKRLGYNG